MSARILRTQHQLSLETESGTLHLNPEGVIHCNKAVTFEVPVTTRANLGVAIGTDVLAHDAKVQSIADLSAGAQEDGKVLSWDNDSSAFVLATDTSNTYTAGNGLNLAANEFSLASSVAGDGLAHNAGVLSVGVDDSTVELDTDALRVKEGGIDTSHLADQAVDENKLASSVAGTGLQGGNGSALAIDSSVATLSGTQTLTNKTLTGPNVSGPIVSGQLYQNSGDGTGQVTHICENASTSDAVEFNAVIDTLSDDQLKHYEVVVMARDQTSKDKACYKLSFVASRDTGVATTALETGPNVEVVHEDDTTWSVSASANTSTGAIRVDVIGDSANEVHWVIRAVATRVA